MASIRQAGVRRIGLGVALAHGLGCLSTPPAVDGGAPIDARDSIDARDGAITPVCVGDGLGDNFPDGELTGVVRESNGLTLDELSEVGYYVSRTFDAGAPRTWRTIAFTPGSPSLKALPDGGGVEAGYPAGNADMSDNLVLLHFDDDGPAFDDDSPHDLAASCAGAGCPVAGEGVFDEALVFDGDDDIVTIPETAELEPPGLTISAWGRADADPVDCGCRMMFVGKGRNAGAPFTSYSIEFDPTTDLLRCYLGLDPEVILESTQPYMEGARVHVACTYDGAEARFYVDGVVVDQQPASGTIDYELAATDALVVGGWGITDNEFGQRFEGMIDEVGLWSRALTESEIEAHADRGYQWVQLQVRTCDEAPCSGPFVGPDGTAETFYSEACGVDLLGPPTLELAGLDCDRDGNPDAVVDPVPPGQFLQYRVQLNSLRTPRRPSLFSVEICE